MEPACVWRNHGVPTTGVTFCGTDSVVSCSLDGAVYEFTQRPPPAAEPNAPPPIGRRWPAMPAFTAQRGARGGQHRASLLTGYWSGAS